MVAIPRNQEHQELLILLFMLTNIYLVLMTSLTLPQELSTINSFHCYSLNVLQRTICWRFGPQGGAIGRWWNLQEVGPGGRKTGPGGVPLREILGSSPLFLFSGCHDMNRCLPYTASMRYCATTCPKHWSWITISWCLSNDKSKQTSPSYKLTISTVLSSVTNNYYDNPIDRYSFTRFLIRETEA